MLVDQDIIYGYRKPKSLQDILVRTDIFSKNKPLRAPKCNRQSSCKHCPRLDKSGIVTSKSTSRQYRSQKNVSCNSSNLIYMIECELCGAQYVGQTKNKLLTRINQHYYSIRHKLETPVSRHFNSHNYQGSPPIRLFVLSLIS